MRQYDVTLRSGGRAQKPSERDIFRIQADSFIHVAATKWFYFTQVTDPGAEDDDIIVAAFPEGLVRSVIQVDAMTGKDARFA